MADREGSGLGVIPEWRDVAFFFTLLAVFSWGNRVESARIVLVSRAEQKSSIVPRRPCGREPAGRT